MYEIDEMFARKMTMLLSWGTMEIEINIKISIFKEIYSEKKFANYEKYRT